jgi:ParB/RepB/Spo0J family partition protein
MDVLSSNSVVLPDGEVVAVSLSQEPWWTTQNATGYLDPTRLSPDPDQPRRHINPDRLSELLESIETRGVRETITITPLSMAPWARPAPGFENAFFLVVSGHRRRDGAAQVGVKAVPVKVKIYASEMDHRMDASLLNKGRDDLTALEEGMEIVHLRSLGWKLEPLCKAFGFKASVQVYNRINLTKLDPAIQARLDPELPEARRLPVTMAGILGGVDAPSAEELEELQDTFQKDIVEPIKNLESLNESERRFALQKTLLAVIEARKLKSLRAITFIREHTLKMESHGGRPGRKTIRFRADKRRDIVANFVTTVTGSLLMDWTPAEFRKAFELAPREEVEGLIGQLQEAGDFVGGLIRQLERIRDEKKPTHPAAIALAEKRKASAQA